MKKLSNKRKSVTFQLLVSYIVILLIPIVISIVTYVQNERAYMQKVISSNHAVVRWFNDGMEQKISAMEGVLMQTVLNPQVEQLLTVKQNQETGNALEQYSIMMTLRNIVMGSSEISEIYLYMHDIDCVFSSESVTTKWKFYDSTHASESFRFEDWQDVMNRTLLRHTMYLPGVEQNGSGYFAFMASYPFVENSQRIATVVVLAERDRLMSQINMEQWLENSSVNVFNRDEELLLYYDKALAEALDIGDLRRDEIVTRQIHGQKYMISYEQSDKYGLKYITCIPSSVFWDNLALLRVLIIGELVFMVALGVSILLFFYKKNYGIINALVKNISKQADRPFWHGENEYAFIQETLSTVIKNRNSAERHLDSQNKIIRNGFLIRLLKGSEQDERKIAHMLHSYNCAFDAPDFVVIAFDVSDHPGQWDDQDDEMVSLVLSNVFEELFSEKFNCIFVSMDNENYVCILNFNCAQVQDVFEVIESVLDNGGEFILQNFDIVFRYAVSCIHHTVMGVSDAYYESMDALRQGKYTGESGVFCSMLEPSENANRFSMEAERRLMNTIRLGDAAGAKKIVTDILAQLTIGNKSWDEIITLKYDIVSAYQKALEGAEHEEFLADIHPAVRVENSKTVAEVQDTLLDLLDVICEYMAAYRQTSNEMEGTPRLSDSVMEYIQVHFSDINLSVNMIADVLGVSTGHISRTFKEQTGENLKDYISRFRIGEAKKLLMENVPIHEIAMKVGFIDSNAFIRVFKKYEGITPGKYKRIL